MYSSNCLNKYTIDISILHSVAINPFVRNVRVVQCPLYVLDFSQLHQETGRCLWMVIIYLRTSTYYRKNVNTYEHHADEKQSASVDEWSMR